MSVDLDGGVSDRRTDVDTTTAAPERRSGPSDDSGASPGSGTRRRRVDRRLLAASMAIAAGLVIIAWGVLVSVTGDERSPLPDDIERIDPVPDAVQVLSQSSVVVDLETGYEGVLVVDGVEIETVNLDELGSIRIEPGKQVDVPPVTVYEPGNATLTFTPSEGAVIEEFDSGLHEVTVLYWKIEEGRQRAEAFRWTFNVV
jgi:hypothetical protein